MPSSSVKDLLSCFSPYLDYYAASHGDGRIKIWDTLRGVMQTEFTDLATASDGFMRPEPERGHLSVDYKCMQWVQLGKTKNKAGQSLLVLGTGSGDVLALDVSTAQQKWRVSDCHPGGVSALSFSGLGSSIYTAGFDGMVCQLDSLTGNLMGKFKAATKPISSIAASSDGGMLAVASAQIKVFSCSDNRKVQKFAGHPVGVRCMSFSEDGNYIISSSMGEKFIALWKIDGTRNYSSCCAFAMEHPAVSIDLKGSCNEENNDTGLFVLAISEAGICYIWHGQNVKKLSSSKATKISVSVQDALSKKNAFPPSIYSARFQNIIKPASAYVMVSYGSLVKPSFEKVSVQYGSDVNIYYSQDGALFPQLQHHVFNKEQVQMRVTTLDRANAEDAVIPLPKMHGLQDKKRKHGKLDSLSDFDAKKMDTEADDCETQSMGNEVVAHQGKIEGEHSFINLEDMLKSVGILSVDDEFLSENKNISPVCSDSLLIKNACSLIDSNKPAKKARESLLRLFQWDTSKLLESFLLIWKTRLVSEQNLLPWICNILGSDKEHLNQPSSQQVIDTLQKMTSFKSAATETLLQLSGRLQLITAQMGKVDPRNSDTNMEDYTDNEEEDDDIDEVVFGHEDGTSESEAD